MNSNLPVLKAVRAGVALFGVAAMLSLSACGDTGQKPVDGLTGKPSDQATSSSTAGVEASASESPTPDPTEDTTYTSDTGYTVPDINGKTSVGEPIVAAQNRFLTAAKKHVENAGSDADILKMGYETCGYYSQSADDTELFEKLETASKGDHNTEVNYVYISGAASRTLCPEYAEFE